MSDKSRKAADAEETVMAKPAGLPEQALQAVDDPPLPSARRMQRVLVGIRQRPGVFAVGAILSIALLRRLAYRRGQY